MAEDIAQVIMKAGDVLTKGEFVKNFEEVLKLVMKLIEKHEQAIQQLFSEHARITGEFKNDYTSNLTQLRKQVNELFVGEQLKKMEGGMKGHMGEMKAEMKKMMDDMMLKMQKKMDSMKDGERGMMGPPGPMGPMPTEHLELMKEVKAELKKVKEVLSNRPQGKAMGRVKVPIIRRVSLTSQVDGNRRSFTLQPDTVQILAIESSQFPFTMDDVDFTLSGNTLTLGDQVPTLQAGQTLIVLAEVLFYP